jgi:regulator of cell morphogenesis and NO signaling
MPNTETSNTTAPAIDPTWSVNEILRRYPAAVTVLNAYGIDSCCGGPRAIADVARAHRLDLPALLAELTELTAA